MARSVDADEIGTSIPMSSKGAQGLYCTESSKSKEYLRAVICGKIISFWSDTARMRRARVELNVSWSTFSSIGCQETGGFQVGIGLTSDPVASFISPITSLYSSKTVVGWKKRVVQFIYQM